jgi:hypothetical protein
VSFARAALLCLLLLPLATAEVGAELQATSRLERTQLVEGEAVQWVIRLEGSGVTVPEPDFRDPGWAHVELRGTERQFTLVNGKPSSAVVYHFLVVPRTPGRHQLPAVTFHVGRSRVHTEAIGVTVVGGGEELERPAGEERLRLVARVDSRRVTAGEPVRLTVRFYQGMRLLADPQYRAPDVPGFWSEKTSEPRSYYVTEQGSRWLVTESYTFLYPTVSGDLSIGSARMICLVPEEAGRERDPFASFLSPGASGKVVEVTSAPIPIEVVPPPAAGRPAGYRGAVGDLRLTVVADRTDIRADEMVNLTLRLTGQGNLRIAPVPGWPDLHDFEIYSHGAEDSLDLEGSVPSGTKRIAIALLPRRQGDLEIPPLEYSVFTPGRGYRTLRSASIPMTVGPPLAEVAGATAIHPLDVPRGVYRPPDSWSGWLVFFLGLGFCFLSLAWLLTRLRARPGLADDAGMRSLRAELDGARREGRTADYLRLAEEWLGGATERPASGEDDRLEERNAAAVLLERVRAARYSPASGGGQMEEIAPMLERQMTTASRQVRSSWSFPWLPALALGLSLVVSAAGIGYAVVRLNSSAASLEISDTWQQAGRYLASGQEERAGMALSALWNEGLRGGPLAAQCAVAALRERRLGEAAVWSERARRESPRDPFVRRVRTFLDEEGTLPGHPEGLGTVFTWRELAAAAALLWAFAALAWALALVTHRLWRPVSLALALLVILACLVSFGVRQSGFGATGAVALESVSLHSEPEGRAELDLEPGRIVGLEETREDWARITLGGGLEGWVPRAALAPVELGAAAP